MLRKPLGELSGGIARSSDESSMPGEPIASQELPAGSEVGGVYGSDLVEAGPTNLTLIPITQINFLKQVRREYVPEEIRSLANSMIKDPEAFENAQTIEDISAAMEMYHTPIVNRLDADHLPEYLQKYSKFYGVDIPVLVTAPDGTTDVNGSGHKRNLAVQYNLKRKGLTPDQAALWCNLYHNLSFEEVLAKQFRENTHTTPPPQDDAYIIDLVSKYFEDLNGEAPSNSQIAGYLGCSVEKVREARAFTSLPQKLQDYVGGKAVPGKSKKQRPIIPYSTLVKFKPLQDAKIAKYEADHRNDPEYTLAARDDYVEKELGTVANHIARMRLERRSAVKIDETLANYIRTAKGELLFTTEELFAVEEDNPTTRHKRSSDILAEKAFAVLQLLADHGELRPDYSTELQAVYDTLARQESERLAIQNQATMF